MARQRDGDVEAARAAVKADKPAAADVSAADMLEGYDSQVRAPPPCMCDAVRALTAPPIPPTRTPGSRLQHHNGGTKFDRAVATFIPKEEAMLCCLPRRVCCGILALFVLAVIGGLVCVVLFWGDIVDAITK